MSKAKVDAYKEQKAHRKEEIAKAKKAQKMNKTIAIAVAVVVIGGLAAALGVTGWNQIANYRDSRPDYNRTEMVVSDYSGILTQDTVAQETEAE